MRLLRPLLPLLAVGLLTTSCEKQDSSLLLDFVSNGTTLTSDRTVAITDTFEVRAFAEDVSNEPALKRFTVTVTDQFYRDIDAPQFEDVPRVYYDIVFDNANLPKNYLFTNRFPASNNAGRQKWTYTVTDFRDRTATRSYTLTTRPADSLNDLRSYTVRLQAPRTSSSRSVLAILRGMALPAYATYQTDYQQLADLVYVPTPTGPTLASPTSDAAASVSLLRAASWQPRRSTQLAATNLNYNEFNGISTPEAMTTVIATATFSANTYSSAAKDRVIAFRTADDKEGLIYVSELGNVAPVDLVLLVKVRRR